MKIKTTAFRNNYPAAIMILIILISSFTGSAQSLDGKFYQPIVPPYSWQSGWFKTNLNIPKSAATTGRDTGAIYYKLTDSSLYTWSGTAWRKVSGSGGGGTLPDGDYGDVSVSGSGTVMTINNGEVINAMLADMPAHTFKGNNTGLTDVPLNLTVAEMQAELQIKPSLLTSVSTNTTVTSAANIYIVSTPSADVTMTVNPANFYSSGLVTVLRFKKITNNAYTVIITPTSGSINGASSYSMALYNESVTVISDGTNLYTF